MATTTMGRSDRPPVKGEDFQSNPDEQAEITAVSALLDLIEKFPAYVPAEHEWAELRKMSPNPLRMFVNGLKRMEDRYNEEDIKLSIEATKPGWADRLPLLFPGKKGRDVSDLNAQAGTPRSAAHKIKALREKVEAMIALNDGQM